MPDASGGAGMFMFKLMSLVETLVVNHTDPFFSNGVFILSNQSVVSRNQSVIIPTGAMYVSGECIKLLPPARIINRALVNNQNDSTCPGNLRQELWSLCYNNLPIFAPVSVEDDVIGVVKTGEIEQYKDMLTDECKPYIAWAEWFVNAETVNASTAPPEEYTKSISEESSEPPTVVETSSLEATLFAECRDQLPDSMKSKISLQRFRGDLPKKAMAFLMTINKCRELYNYLNPNDMITRPASKTSYLEIPPRCLQLYNTLGSDKQANMRNLTVDGFITQCEMIIKTAFNTDGNSGKKKASTGMKKLNADEQRVAALTICSIYLPSTIGLSFLAFILVYWQRHYLMKRKQSSCISTV